VKVNNNLAGINIWIGARPGEFFRVSFYLNGNLIVGKRLPTQFTGIIKMLY
jgi:hypothetical protein